MKLTNYMRDAFVSAAMSDVPKIDYDEAIRIAATKLHLDACPKAVRELWNNQDTRQYLETMTVRYGSVSVRVPGFYSYSEGKYIPDLTAEQKKPAQDLADKDTAQESERKALQSKLRAAVSACTTRKALAELLPEFEKYLPADNTAITRNLPAVANIMADFTKAGWPKAGKKTAK